MCSLQNLFKILTVKLRKLLSSMYIGLKCSLSGVWLVASKPRTIISYSSSPPPHLPSFSHLSPPPSPATTVIAGSCAPPPPQRATTWSTGAPRRAVAAIPAPTTATAAATTGSSTPCAATLSLLLLLPPSLCRHKTCNRRRRWAFTSVVCATETWWWRRLQTSTTTLPSKRASSLGREFARDTAAMVRGRAPMTTVVGASSSPMESYREPVRLLISDTVRTPSARRAHQTRHDARAAPGNVRGLQEVVSCKLASVCGSSDMHCIVCCSSLQAGSVRIFLNGS